MRPSGLFPTRINLEIWIFIDSRQDSSDGGSAPSQGRYVHTTTGTKKKRGQTSMSRVGFEPTIPVFEGGKVFHGLDLAATAIDR
jgi:ribosomal protein L4